MRSLLKFVRDLSGSEVHGLTPIAAGRLSQLEDCIRTDASVVFEDPPGGRKGTRGSVGWVFVGDRLRREELAQGSYCGHPIAM